MLVKAQRLDTMKNQLRKKLASKEKAWQI